MQVLGVAGSNPYSVNGNQKSPNFKWVFDLKPKTPALPDSSTLYRYLCECGGGLFSDGFVGHQQHLLAEVNSSGNEMMCLFRAFRERAAALGCGIRVLAKGLAECMQMEAATLEKIDPVDIKI